MGTPPLGTTTFARAEGERLVLYDVVETETIEDAELKERRQQAQRMYERLVSIPTSNHDGSLKDGCAEECTICLCAFSAGDKVKTLPCKHHFHSRCLRTWLNHKESIQCPICRSECGASGNACDGGGTDVT